MTGQKLDAAKLAAKTLVARMSLERDQIGLVTFAHGATLNQRLTQDQNALIAAIDTITTANDTNITAGIAMAEKELTSRRHHLAADPVLILLSDGRATIGGDPRTAADDVKALETGIRIITIGLGADADAEVLGALATSSADYYFAPSSTDLERIYETIAGLLHSCDDVPTVTPTPIRPCQMLLAAPTPVVTAASIAVVGPFTGARAPNGEAMLHGTCLAYNDLASHNIGVVTYDDASGAAPVAAQIAADPNILCVVGNSSARATSNAISVYTDILGADPNLVLILPSVSDPTVTRSYPSAWRLVGTDRGQVQAALRFIQGHFTSKRILLVHDRRSDSTQLVALFKAFAAQQAPSIAIQEYPFGFGQLQYLNRTATLTQTAGLTETAHLLDNLGQVQPDDVIFFAGDATDLMPFIQRVRASGITVPIIGTDGTDSPELRAKKTDPAYHAIYYITMAAPPDRTGTFAQRYIESGFAADSDAIRAYAAESYDAMSLCIRAINDARSTLKPGRPLDRAAVLKAMEQITQRTIPRFREAGTFNARTDTYAGPYDFDQESHGNLATASYFIRKVGEATVQAIYICVGENADNNNPRCVSRVPTPAQAPISTPEQTPTNTPVPVASPTPTPVATKISGGSAPGK
jgi:ABC-type branched-subunit amino acid transport system substrate-binding protein